MRRLAAATAALLAAACNSSPTARSLVILHTNDEHSHLVGDGPEADDFPAPTSAGSGSIKGGLARRAALFASERAAAAAAGADVLTVSAGDNAMGTLAELGFTDGADYQSLGLLKYDVTTLGNHEFDYGPDGLAASISAAFGANMGAPPIVASNIHFSGTSGDANLAGLFDESGADATRPMHRTWVITTAGGIKVGFVGVVGVDAAQKAPLKSPVTFSVAPLSTESDSVSALAQLFDDLQPLVDKLRAQDKVDLVVLLSHSGVNPADVEAGEDQQIAENVGGIDVIVSGHTHTNYPAALVTNPKTQRQVLIQQAGRYGDHYGRIALTVKLGDSVGDTAPVAFDMTRSTTVEINDATVPDTTAATFVSSLYGELETTPVAALDGLSYLEYTASITAGAQLTASASDVGSVAFAPIVKSGYTIHEGAVDTEAPMLRAASDAMLAAADQTAGHTDVAIEAAGVIRDDIIPATKGAAAGSIAFADLFQSVPLGASPAGTPGYPLVRFGVYLAELKAIFEVTAGLAYTSVSNGDYFVVPSGACFRYDTSLPMFDTSGSATDPTNGRVTEIRIMADHTRLDSCLTEGTLVYSTDPHYLALSSTGYLESPLALISLSTNLYIAEFAAVAGVHLKDPDSGLPLASPVDGIFYSQIEPDVYVEVKEWEALGGWLRALAAANGGTLPAIYNDAVSAGQGPFRAACSGPLCSN